LEAVHLYESSKRFLDADNFRDAAELLEHALVLFPERPFFWTELGTCYREDKRTTEAAFCYSRAKAIDPNNFSVAFHLAVLKADIGSWAEAEEHFKDALRLKPSDTHTLMNLAGVLRKLQKLEESEALVRRALELDPSLVGSLPPTGKSS
jgi:tetratricopeptide (TPR) repeat protein